jgi:hypothetical protein
MTDQTARDTAPSFSFVACVSEQNVLRANLMRSPCLAPGTSHELITVPNPSSAGAGLNEGLEQADRDWVICVHQDVWLPAGWDQCVADQLRQAEDRFGRVGVAGVYGVSDVVSSADATQQPTARAIGWVVDRGHELRSGGALPARVANLDELLLIIRRRSALSFDPQLGFHLYGADICLQARDRGLAVVALGALCHHNSRTTELPPSFAKSVEIFARKWHTRLPIITTCALIDRVSDPNALVETADAAAAFDAKPTETGDGAP